MSIRDPEQGADGKCGATNQFGDRAGERCDRPAGMGTDHAGVGRCFTHGGNSPGARKSGAVQLATMRATKVLDLTDTADIDPHEAILKCIRISNAMVDYATLMIADLDPLELVGPVVTTRPLKEEKGAESSVERVEEHGAPGVHIWIEVQRRAMRDLVDFAKAAIVAGIAERQIKVAEDQAQQMAGAVRRILDGLGVADHPDAPAIVRREFTLLAGGMAA